MNPLSATAICRALIVFVCSLAAVTAPVAAGFDCRATGVPAKCKCCANPQAGCCAASQHQPERPVPIAPMKTTNLRDTAPPPVTVIAVLLPVAPREFLNAASGAADCVPHVARHSLLCVRRV